MDDVFVLCALALLLLMVFMVYGRGATFWRGHLHGLIWTDAI